MDLGTVLVVGLHERRKVLWRLGDWVVIRTDSAGFRGSGMRFSLIHAPSGKRAFCIRRVKDAAVLVDVMLECGFERLFDPVSGAPLPGTVAERRELKRRLQALGPDLLWRDDL